MSSGDAAMKKDESGRVNGDAVALADPVVPKPPPYPPPASVKPVSSPVHSAAPSFSFMRMSLIIILSATLAVLFVLQLLHFAGYHLEHRSSSDNSLPIPALLTTKGVKAVWLNTLLAAVEHIAGPVSLGGSTSAKSSQRTGADSKTTKITDDSNKGASSNSNAGSTTTTTTTATTSSTAAIPNEKRNVRFVNNMNVTLNLYWVNFEQQETLINKIEPTENVNMGTFRDHLFVFRRAADNTFVRSVVVKDKQNTAKASLEGESQFHLEYEEKNGRPWINVYPRDRMIHHVHDPVSVGHKFTVRTTAPYMHVEPGSAEYPKDLQADGTPAGELELQVETLATDPRIFLVENFLSEFETTKLIDLTIKTGQLKRSGVELSGKIIADRTSSSMFLDYDNKPFMANVKHYCPSMSNCVVQLYRRGFELMGVKGGPDNYTRIGENFQMLHYALEQQYTPHHDYFDPFADAYRKSANIQKGSNRMGTLFLYLNDVESGGETVFPRVNDRFIHNACENADGFKVKPKRGRAVIFYSMMPDGNLDENSLHGGCPVKKGEKWAANWWFWDPNRFD